MRQNDWERLNEIVVDATREVLAAQRIEVTYAGAALHERRWADTISIIGLGGAALRGSLVLSVPSAVLRASHPAGATEDEALADWLAELANLLLGQVKRRLLPLGVTVEMSTPLTLSATAFRFHRFKGLPVTHAFQGDGGDVRVMFEAVGDDGAQLAPPAEEPVALDAGEMVLF